MNGYSISSTNYASYFGDEQLSASKSSISEARAKIDWRGFAALLEKAKIRESELSDKYKWRGHLVYCADGSKVNMPYSSDVIKTYPTRVNKHDTRSHYPFGITMVVSNAYTGQPVVGNMRNMHSNERCQFLDLLPKLEKNSICLLDRGIDGKRVWESFKNRHFVGRVKHRRGVAKEIMAFANSGRLDEIVLLGGELRLRLIRSQTGRGDPMFFATNLMDSNLYPRDEIIQLYRKRWQAETNYMRIKNLLNLDQFHSKKLNGILQEFYANLTILSLTALAIVEARETYPDKPGEECFKNAVEVLKRNIPLWIDAKSHLSTQKKKHVLQVLFQQIARERNIIRPGRRYPRVCYKPVNKWAFAKRHKILAFSR